MIIVESIISVDDHSTTFRASCGHHLRTVGTLTPGQSIYCILCATDEANREGRDTLQFPPNDKTLDLLAADYIKTMEAQGHKFSDEARRACRRAANIQLAWYAALRRVIG